MLVYFIIGLVCNTQSCYWIKANDTEFTEIQACQQQAQNLKKVSIMYFETSCMAKGS